MHKAPPKVGTWESLFARKTTDNGLTKYGEAETKEQLANIEEEMHEDGEASCSEGKDEEDEEARRAKVRKSPKGPTKVEREEHEATHLPFREWCRHCVRGRGGSKPHRRQVDQDAESEERKVSRIAISYAFMSTEDEKSGKNPVLMMKDESTGARYMRAAGRKGIAATTRWTG